LSFAVVRYTSSRTSTTVPDRASTAGLTRW
jgi:hypothetical protein